MVHRSAADERTGIQSRPLNEPVNLQQALLFAFGQPPVPRIEFIETVDQARKTHVDQCPFDGRTVDAFEVPRRCHRARQRACQHICAWPTPADIIDVILTRLSFPGKTVAQRDRLLVIRASCRRDAPSRRGQKLNKSAHFRSQTERGSKSTTNLLKTQRRLKADGAQGRDRTTDTAIFSRMLYQLSYLGAAPDQVRGAPVYSQAASPCPPAGRQFCE